MSFKVYFVWMMVTAVCLCSRAAAQPIPTMIDKDELPTFAKWLTLSDAQVGQMHSLHDAYVANWQGSYGEKIAEYGAVRYEAMMGTRSNPDVHGGESVVATVELAAEMADDLRGRLDAANSLFFTQCSVILSGEQASRLERVRLGHERRRTLKRSFTAIRESNIDPIDLVEQLILSPDEESRVQALIDNYEPILVSALREVAIGTERGMKHEAVAAEWLRAQASGAVDVQEGLEAIRKPV